MTTSLLTDFVSLFSELKTLSLKDWTTLLPILIGFAAYLWRKMLSKALHKILLFFSAPSMIENLQITLTHIEKHLAMHEGRYRMLMSNMQVPMWEADEKGHWTWCNDELLALLDTDINSVLQDKWLHFVVDEEVERVSRGWYEAVDKDRTVHQIFNIVGRDGESVRVRATSELIKNSKNEVVCILGAFAVLK